MGQAWVYFGIFFGMAMVAASPSSIMEAAFGRLHNSEAGAFGARPTFVESIMMDGETGGSKYGRIYCTIYGTTYLAIHQYGFHNSGAGAEGARPTVMEAADGRLHIGGWEGREQNHASHPYKTYLYPIRIRFSNFGKNDHDRV